MSEETQEVVIKTVLKGGAGYDAPWTTVETSGNSPTVAVLHETVLDAIKGDLLQKTTNLNGLFIATNNAAPLTTGGGSASAESAPASSSGGVSNIPTCDHGKRVEKSGTSAKGPWKGYFCALPKGAAGACKPVWAD